jgi:hypothetical protein
VGRARSLVEMQLRLNKAQYHCWNQWMFSQNEDAVVTDAWLNRLLFGLSTQQDMRLSSPPNSSITYIVADYMPLISSS